MVTDRTRAEVWQGLWDSQRMVRYYQALHGHYLRRNRVTMWALVVFGTGAFVALWERMPDIAQPLVGLAVAVTSLWVLFADYAAKAAVAQSIAAQCEELATEWATLFAQLDDPGEELGEPRVRASLDDLKRRMTAATYRSGDANIPDNQRINERATAAATEALKAAYA